MEHCRISLRDGLTKLANPRVIRSNHNSIAANNSDVAANVSAAHYQMALFFRKTKFDKSNADGASVLVESPKSLVDREGDQRRLIRLLD